MEEMGGFAITYCLQVLKYNYELADRAEGFAITYLLQVLKYGCLGELAVRVLRLLTSCRC